MAQAQRNDIDHRAGPLPQYAAGDHRYHAGGHVAQLQADLAHRLADRGVLDRPMPVNSPAERLVRFCSVAGGYGALAAGYAGVAMAIAHWL